MNKFFLAIIFLSFDVCSQTNYKIAFVKQVVYQDLYCSSSDSSISDIIFSSYKRSGPVGLFTKFDTDFYIVDVEKDPECNIWKEKCKPENIATYEALKTNISSWGQIAGHKFSQGHYSRKCADINWEKYDIVITLDAAIPARITLKYPKILWTYYIGEGVQPTFKASFKKPVKGYDCFLTQDCSLKTNNQSHIIEFPYHLQYFGCFHELLKIKEKDLKREGIYLETHTDMYFKSNNDQLQKLSNICNVKRYMHGISLKEMIFNHLNSKYFIQFIDSKKTKIRSGTRGNAVIQAIASGNLAIAKKENIKNIDILTPNTLVNTFEDLIRVVNYFEKNPDMYKKELKLQRQKLNYLCFNRPMNELFKKAELKKLKYFRHNNR